MSDEKNLHNYSVKTCKNYLILYELLKMYEICCLLHSPIKFLVCFSRDMRSQDKSINACKSCVP